jgi:hypothetical protein
LEFFIFYKKVLAAYLDIVRQAIFWNIPRKRSVGRRRVTWRSSVEKETEQQGKNLAEVAAAAQN